MSLDHMKAFMLLDVHDGAHPNPLAWFLVLYHLPVKSSKKVKFAEDAMHFNLSLLITSFSGKCRNANKTQHILTAQLFEIFTKCVILKRTILLFYPKVAFQP